MKNTIAIIIVIVLIVLGVFLLKGKDMKSDINESGDKSDMGDMKDMEESSSTSGTTTTTVDTGISAGVTVGAVKEFTVEAKNFSFAPSAMTVNKGDKVKITFKNTQGFHDFVLPDFNAKSKQTQGPSTEVLEFTADKTGSFEFYCSVGSHRAMGMKGTFIVK